LFVLGTLLLPACDEGELTEWVSPRVLVSLTDGIDDALSKSSAILTVELEVLSEGGSDFSPEPVTVDNNTTNQVAFEISIPADAVYSFLVRFSNSGTLVGEGATVQEVTLETTVVDIDVLTRSASTPSLGFLPSQVNTSTGSGNIEITVRYYGAGTPVAGIAALFDITGSTPRAFTLDGPDFSLVEGRELNAAWQFGQDVQGVRDIGTLRVPRNQTADFCLEATTENIRVVDRAGAITTAGLLGTCIEVTP
jgi:hypothetical protein